MSPFLLVALGVALAKPAPCPEGAETYIDALIESPDKTTYLCLIEHEAMLDPLVSRVRIADLDDVPQGRLTRALTLHLAARSNTLFEADLVRLLSPADRRLLADAVRAYSGRKSPVAANDAVFALQSWYRPRKVWSPNVLNEVQRANIRMADRPPPVGQEPLGASEPDGAQVVLEPAPPPPAEAPVEAPGCGCAAPGLAPGAWWLVVGALAMLGRRRTR